MAELQGKEYGSGQNDHEVQEMYHAAVGDHSSDEPKNSGETIDATDMYRMGKEQQFRVSIAVPSGRCCN
jgi:hypothetical protein